jgi:3-hydroxyacyl-[acyl-carrier-protein] dehydratase
MKGVFLYARDEVERWIPQRPPLLLLDGIDRFEAGATCTSRWRVEEDEPVLAGHFPGDPVLPGVYLLEHLAQTACFLAERSRGRRDGVPVLARIERASFHALVRPGAEVVSEITLERAVANLERYSGTSRVDGRAVCRAELVVGRALAEGGER